jgi:hypothetical protein
MKKVHAKMAPKSLNGKQNIKTKEFCSDLASTLLK